MRELTGIIALLPLVTWLLTYKKHRDIATPYNVFTVLYFINILIPMLLYMDKNTAYSIKELYLRNSVLNDSVYVSYVVLQTVCYYLVIFGSKLCIRRKAIYSLQPTANSKLLETSQQQNYGKYKVIGISLWIVGAIAFLGIMHQVGGIFYFFTHLQYRTSLTRNIDLLSWILPFVNYGTLFVVYSHKGTGQRLTFGTIAMIVLSGIMSGLGGRKALIMLFIEAMLLYHYCVRKIKIRQFIKLKYILAALMLYLFFILMTKFRVEGALESFIKNPIEFISASNDGILSTIRNESYVTFYMALINYFRSHALWYGKTFLGLITAVVPSSIYPSKPPVDDGAYLYSICMGRADIVPPMSFQELNGSSYPLETFGSMYANFGLTGLFIGMIVLGIIYGYTYRRMKRNSYNLFDVLIYIQVIFTFQLSTLRIFQTIELIVIWGMVTFASERIKG